MHGSDGRQPRVHNVTFLRLVAVTIVALEQSAGQGRDPARRTSEHLPKRGKLLSIVSARRNSQVRKGKGMSLTTRSLLPPTVAAPVGLVAAVNSRDIAAVERTGDAGGRGLRHGRGRGKLGDAREHANEGQDLHMHFEIWILRTALAFF